MFNYTWSKSLSMMHYRQIFGNSGYMTQDAYNLKDSKSYLPFDQTQVTSILTSYDLPFGKGKRYFANTNPVVDRIISNWSISGAQKYRSGNLIRLTATANTLGTYLGAMTTKANTTGSAIRSSVERTDLQYNNTNVRYFNSGVFSNPATFAYGTAAFYQPGYKQPPVMTENLSIVKKFEVYERFKFTLRADGFNIFNRTNFAVATNWASSSFGYASGVQNGPRMITLGLRLDF
jgi:hypothetical protein